MAEPSAISKRKCRLASFSFPGTASSRVRIRTERVDSGDDHAVMPVRTRRHGHYRFDMLHIDAAQVAPDFRDGAPQHAAAQRGMQFIEPST